MGDISIAKNQHYANPCKIIFNNITDIIVLCDSDYSIIESNESSNYILGKGESIIGSKCYNVFREQTRPCLDCPLKPTLKSGTIIPLVSYDKRFGEYFEENTYPVLDEDEKLSSFIIVCKNVTKVKAMEEKSAQMKKLSALGKISSGVAHDFNNMLTVILGRIQLLKRQYNSPKLITSLGIIEKAAYDGAEKVRKIKEFSRPDQKHSNLESIDIKKLILEVMELTRPRWEEASKIKGILIQPIYKFQDDLYVTANASDLRNVFTNIIFNAIDAMPDGGIISFKTEIQNNEICIIVRDTGIGMTDETLEKIFDPFFTTKGVSGTGMGMSEVYGIIKNFKGRVSVKSRVGKGSTLFINLPNDQLNALQPKGNEIDKKPITVLVYDKEDYIRKILNDLLSAMGYNVDTVNNQKETIVLFKENIYDIVIVDMGVPDMSGIQIAKDIKQIKASTQVLLTSGLALGPDEAKYFDDTIDHIINKPLSIEKIQYAISESVLAVKNSRQQINLEN